MFTYKRRIHFYETDAMGIVHHSHYIKILEEARVAWLRQFSSEEDKKLLGETNYPVLHCEVTYKNPLEFDQEVSVTVDAHQKGARLVFDYIMSTKSFDKPVAFGKTIHVAFDMKSRRPTKLPQKVLDFLAGRG
ncbi:MAG: acyl-CoA thioesterase [Bdellovibrionales bacterium]|nr:acyl-CoA thioesterase [Bdellovibrionales bacterium]